MAFFYEQECNWTPNLIVLLWSLCGVLLLKRVYRSVVIKVKNSVNRSAGITVVYINRSVSIMRTALTESRHYENFINRSEGIMRTLLTEEWAS